MTKNITPYKNSKRGKKQQITKMFDTIAGEYDSLNRVISFGIDIKWRNKVVDVVKEKKPNNILDIATGTGDLAINLANSGAKEIVGLDISRGMLEIGKEKIRLKQLSDVINMQIGDSENLNFSNDSFDAVTVAFGARNFETLEKGLKEIFRVLKPGGIFIILETSVPKKIPFRQGYFIYTKLLLPLIGILFSRDKKAYSYLSNSAAKFPCGEDFNNILRKVGFINVTDQPQTFGVATIYKASKK